MFFDLKPPLPNRVGYQCKRHKLTTGKELIMDGYSDWQLLLGAGVATSTYIFVIVQLLNNLIPRWKEYVGLEERRD
jgi:hypothetical protein